MTLRRLALAQLLLVSSLAGCLVHERPEGCDVCDAEARDGGGVDARLDQDASAPDAFVMPDAAGRCPLCPALEPGCVYDGVPCACSHTTCTPEHCGRHVCGEGTTCCNPSCSQCVAPDGDCLAVECAPDCSPQDAHSGGRCAGDAGYAWDGTACRQIACRCIGSECADAFASEEACNAYFGMCPATIDCHTDDATGEGGCAVVIGYAFTARGCMPISGCSCTGADCAAIEGQSEEQCNSLHAMCPILFI